VAAVVPTIAGPVFMEMVESLTAALAEAGYQLMLGQSGYTQSREDALLDAIIGRRPMASCSPHHAFARRPAPPAGERHPVVETWDLTPTPIDMLVGFSHVHAGLRWRSTCTPRVGARGAAEWRRRARAAPQPRLRRRSPAPRARA
jgi:LacI family gluconate utilization system Gnt-I transcriptional repressor